MTEEDGEKKSNPKATTLPCPNRGPGRYDGNQYACAAEIVEGISNHGWADASYGDADSNTAADFVEGLIDAATIQDVYGQRPCSACEQALIRARSGGLGLFTNGYGARMLEVYESHQAYVSAARAAAAAEGEEYEAGDE